MALILMEGFDAYPDLDAMANSSKWGAASTSNKLGFTTGRFGSGQSWGGINASSGNIESHVRAFQEIFSVVFGVAISNSALPSALESNNTKVISFNYASVSQFHIRVGSNGIGVYNGDNQLQAAYYGSGILDWAYLEVKATLSATVGTVIVRVDETEIINASNLDLVDNSYPSNGITGVSLLTAYDSSQKAIFDDMYILDTTGASLNDFLGDCRVDTLYGNADSSVQFSRSGGTTNYENVDEAQYDDDTSYVYSSTATHKDLYDYTALPAGAGDVIHAVCVNAVARKETAGGRWLKVHTKDGANLQNSGNLSLSTGYKLVYENFPTYDGTNAWTIAKIDGGQFGFEVV